MGTATTVRATLVLLLSWGPAGPGLLLSYGAPESLEAVGTFSVALAFGGAAALLAAAPGPAFRGGGGPLVVPTFAVAAVGAGASTLAAGLRSRAMAGEGGLWLDLLEVAWMPGGLTIACVLSAAVLTGSRALLAAGAVVAAGVTATTTAEMRLQRDIPLDIVLWALWLALGVASAVIVAVVARRRRAPERQVAVWLALAHAAVLVCAVGAYVVDDASGTTSTSATFAATFLPAAVTFAAAAFLLTALTGESAAVAPALARVTVWVLLIAALLVAYGAVAALAAKVAPLTPTSGGMIAVVVLAVGVGPTRRWVQRAVDQLLYGGSADPSALLRKVSEEVAAGAEGAGSLDALAEALRRSLRLGGVAIRSAAPGGPAVVAGTVDPATSVSLELVAADGPCGEVEMSAEWGRDVEMRTLAALRRIGGVLTVAVRLAEVNDDLLEARRRASEIAASERHLARTEIEATVEPMLVRIRDDLGGVAAGAEPADELARAGTALRAATTHVRDLARTLLPGSLDAGDLPGALGELAARFDIPVLRADVAHPPERPEVVYHLVAEAVLRARRDGGIERVEVAVVAPDRWTLRLLGDADRTTSLRAALLERAADAGYGHVGPDDGTTLHLARSEPR
ncbi:hypothetical protein ABFU82_18065 [Nocardioides sp. WV_118_6]